LCAAHIGPTALALPVDVVSYDAAVELESPVQSPLTRAAVVLVVVAAIGWSALAVVVAFSSGGWFETLMAAFVVAASTLAVWYAWPQLNRPDPACRSTLVLLLYVMLVVGMFVSLFLLADDDVSFGTWRWVGPAALLSAGVPLIMLKWLDLPLLAASERRRSMCRSRTPGHMGVVARDQSICVREPR
jgi:hypothetical protein